MSVRHHEGSIYFFQDDKIIATMDVEDAVEFAQLILNECGKTY